MLLSKRFLLVGIALAPLAGPAVGQTSTEPAASSVVLVHGAFVDGSGWKGVHDRLTHNGYTVSVVQHETRTLEDDVAATRRAIAAAPGKVILVGHSYGGVVVSEAGNDPKVAAMVYVAAFAPDAGESVQTLISTPVPGAPSPPILPPVDGYLTLDRSKFAEAFAADVPGDVAAFMANSQLPWGVAALSGIVSVPAWRTKPTRYIVATSDRMIPPAAQRMMAARANARVTELTGSHAIYISQPDAVAAVIEEAAQATAE